MACCKFKEFEGYGKNKRQVQSMVNNNNVGICTKFFQCDVSLIKQFSLNFF